MAKATTQDMYDLMTANGPIEVSEDILSEENYDHNDDD